MFYKNTLECCTIGAPSIRNAHVSGEWNAHDTSMSGAPSTALAQVGLCARTYVRAPASHSTLPSCE